MKLYRVRVETEVMVVAENEEDAEYEASGALRDIALNEPFDFYAREVKDKKELKEWVNCIPYGGSSDKPCLEYMIEDIF